MKKIILTLALLLCGDIVNAALSSNQQLVKNFYDALFSLEEASKMRRSDQTMMFYRPGGNLYYDKLPLDSDRSGYLGFIDDIIGGTSEILTKVVQNKDIPLKYKQHIYETIKALYLAGSPHNLSSTSFNFYTKDIFKKIPISGKKHKRSSSM